jgi:hypothetical protein
MKNRFVKMAVLLGIAATASSQNSFADSLTDTITYSPSKTISHNNEFTDTFDITTQGFVVGTDVVSGGTASFDLSAGTGTSGNYKITIDLGTLAVVDNGGLQDYTFNLGPGAVSDLNADGKLDFTLFQNNSSMTYLLNSAELDLTYNVPANPNSQSPVASVPDASSTALLLGSACLSLLFLRSRALPRQATVKVK